MTKINKKSHIDLHVCKCLSYDLIQELDFHICFCILSFVNVVLVCMYEENWDEYFFHVMIFSLILYRNLTSSSFLKDNLNVKTESILINILYLTHL
jgi:hypothetical protein